MTDDDWFRPFHNFSSSPKVEHSDGVSTGVGFRELFPYALVCFHILGPVTQKTYQTLEPLM